MHEARKLQDERAAQPQNRSSVRHKQPPRVRAQGCDLIGHRPELPAQPRRSAEVRRSGQCTRRAVSGALGRGKSCCGRGSSDGGGWPCPQQPCSRHHYNAGRVRLPGESGLEGADRPGRLRAEARYVRKRGSFGGLQFHGNKFGEATIVDPGDITTLCSFDSTHPITRRNRTATAHSLCGSVSDTDVGCEVSYGWP